MVTLIYLGIIGSGLYYSNKLNKTKKNGWDARGFHVLMTTLVFAIIGGIFVIPASIWTFVTDQTVGSEITLLEEMNADIDNEVQAMVQSYQEYELKAFDKDTSATVIVQMYPELKSNILVEKQMETYVANKEAIKDLRMTKINNDANKKLWYLWGK